MLLTCVLCLLGSLPLCVSVAFSVHARHNEHIEIGVFKYCSTTLELICDENVHFGHFIYENLSLFLTYF